MWSQNWGQVITITYEGEVLLSGLIEKGVNWSIEFALLDAPGGNEVESLKYEDLGLNDSFDVWVRFNTVGAGEQPYFAQIVTGNDCEGVNCNAGISPPPPIVE